jgi:hypothetical protein
MTRRIALFAIAFVLGCASPDGPCVVADGIAGTWTYQATRESPVPGTITGTLVIGSQGCVDFQGAMDVVETLATGETHRVTGPVSGTIDGELVRFEASLAGGAREHFARLVGDSLSGSWIEPDGTIPGSGEFGGRRQKAN